MELNWLLKVFLQSGISKNLQTFSRYKEFCEDWSQVFKDTGV